MKLTKEIDREDETLPDEKVGDLFFAMLKGQTVKDTISTSRGDFVVKYPKQQDLITIARMAAYMRGGIPAGNFDAAGDYEIQKIATLDVTVASGPAWFNNARKHDKNFSWRSVPDANFVDEVYAKALSFRQEVQDRLKNVAKPFPEESIEPLSGDIPSDVGNGLFSGVASPAGGT